MPDVEVTNAGAVLTITLNRPDVLNALNRAVHAGIHDGLVRAAADPGVRAVVITGAGRGFCVGQDLQEFGAAPATSPRTCARTTTATCSPSGRSRSR